MEKVLFTIVGYLSLCDTQVPVSKLSLLPNQQTLQIFAENCCNGKSEIYTKPIRDLENESIILSKKKIKSFSVHRGIWYLSPTPNFTSPGIYYSDNFHHERDMDDKALAAAIKGTCGSTRPSSGTDDEAYTQYKSVRFVGNSRFHLPGLSLYSIEHFGGQELYFDGRVLRLPEPITIKSFGFTGRDHDIWRVFSFRNFTGNERCWKGNKHKIVNYNTHKVEFQVGSILRTSWKCGNDKSENISSKEAVDHKMKSLISINNQLVLHYGSGTRLQTDSYELRLPQPKTFLSYSFVGSSNWTIYSDVDFTGKKLCLHNNPKMNRKGGQVKLKLNATVGSMRRGCEDDPIQSTYEENDFAMLNMESNVGVGTIKPLHNFRVVIFQSLSILVLTLMLK